MIYRLKQGPGFRHFIKKVKDKSLQRKIQSALKDIQELPLEAGELKKGDLKGIYCYDIRHRKVSYEVAYVIEQDDEGDLVIVILAGTRENFYNELKRYIEL